MQEMLNDHFAWRQCVRSALVRAFNAHRPAVDRACGGPAEALSLTASTRFRIVHRAVWS